jgi:hypothetical protein
MVETVQGLPHRGGGRDQESDVADKTRGDQHHDGRGGGLVHLRDLPVPVRSRLRVSHQEDLQHLWGVLVIGGR